jgi:hypothetical protein
MTPASFRHCAVVRLLARAHKQPDGQRLVSPEEWRAWADELAELEPDLGGLLARSMKPTQPTVDVEDLVAILDLALKNREQLLARERRT